MNSKFKIWLATILFIPAWLLINGLFGIALSGAIAVFSGQSFQDAINIFKTADDTSILLNQAIMLLGSLLSVWLFWVVILKKKFLNIGLNWGKTSLQQIFIGLGSGIILITGCILVLYLNGNLAITNLSFNPISFFTYLLLFILVAFNEELVMRGYLLGNLTTVANKYIALILVSLLFSFAHFLNPEITLLGKFNIILAGILLGIPYIHSKSLWFPIGLHFSWNFLQGPVFGSPVSGNLTHNNILEHNVSGNKHFTGGEFGFEGSLVLSTIMILLIIALDLYFRRQTKSMEQFACGFNC